MSDDAFYAGFGIRLRSRIPMANEIGLQHDATAGLNQASEGVPVGAVGALRVEPQGEERASDRAKNPIFGACTGRTQPARQFGGLEARVPGRREAPVVVRSARQSHATHLGCPGRDEGISIARSARFSP